MLCPLSTQYLLLACVWTTQFIQLTHSLSRKVSPGITYESFLRISFRLQISANIIRPYIFGTSCIQWWSHNFSSCYHFTIFNFACFYYLLQGQLISDCHSLHFLLFRSLVSQFFLDFFMDQFYCLFFLTYQDQIWTQKSLQKEIKKLPG